MPDNVQKRFLEQLVNGKIDMNTKYLSLYPEWHCKRNGGGLYLGLRMMFPRNIWRNDALGIDDTYKAITLQVGLVFFTLRFDFKYNYKDIPWPKPLDPPTTTAEAEARQKKFEDNIRHIQG
jgi:hypothetical protein